VIGLFSDSHGDLNAFDAAYEFLRGKGAKRFFFLGGRYSDLDEWVLTRKQRARGNRAYNDQDFLTDIATFLASQDQVERAARQDGEDPSRLGEKFLRVPERESLQYRDPQIIRKAVDMLGQTLCSVVHDKNDLTREDLLNANIFIHGKDPEPRVVQIGPRYFINPGQLTGAAEQTCGLIEVVEPQLIFSAFTLEGRTLVDAQRIQVARRNKISAE
jgi:hypothetical protein